MEKMSCDIIQDLIPSYVDEICSEATKTCVEEHMKTCDKCRRLMQLCRNSAFSGEEIEKQELDGLKKIHRAMIVQKCVIGILLLIIVATGLWTFEEYLNRYVCYGCFIVCIICTLLISASTTQSRKPGKKEYIIGLLSLLADAYITWMILYGIRQVAAGILPFGIEEIVKIGPFMERQLIIIFLLQMVCLFYHFICMIKHEMKCGSLLCFDLMGLFLMLGSDISLKNLSTFEEFTNGHIQMTVVTVLIGLIGVIVSVVIAKYKKWK